MQHTSNKRTNLESQIIEVCVSNKERFGGESIGLDIYISACDLVHEARLAYVRVSTQDDGPKETINKLKNGTHFMCVLFYLVFGSIEGRRARCCLTCSRYAKLAPCFFIRVHILKTRVVVVKGSSQNMCICVVFFHDLVYLPRAALFSCLHR